MYFVKERAAGRGWLAIGARGSCGVDGWIWGGVGGRDGLRC